MLRGESGKASLPKRKGVATGDPCRTAVGRDWAMQIANAARRFQNMGVMYSNIGEYRDATDVLLPRVASR